MKTVEELLKDTADLVGASLKELTTRGNEGSNVKRGKEILACALGERWNDDDHGRVQNRLDCPRGFVVRALERAKVDTAFRAEVEMIKGTAEKTADDAVESSDVSDASDNKDESDGAADTDIEALLFRVAQDQYGVSRDVLRTQLQNKVVARACRVLVCLADRAFSMTKAEITHLLGRGEETIERLLRETTYDFTYDAHFRTEVNKACELFGVTIGKAKPPA